MRKARTYSAPTNYQKADFEKVLDDEIDLIEERRRLRDGTEHPAPAQTHPYDRALRSDLIGLSFSGGGIRSATFNLGVLQGLAKLKLLSKFDYLSTVSGGGYIGSWLTALIHRSSQEDTTAIREIEERIRTDQQDLEGKSPEQTDEDPAIGFLRRFSNYLTPSVGFFSADTWAVIATYLRNLLLTLSTLIAGVSLVLLLPRIVRLLSDPFQAMSATLLLALILMLFALVTAVLAVGAVGFNMGGSSEDVDPEWRTEERLRFLSQGWVLRLVVLPLMVAAVGGALWLALPTLEGEGWRKTVVGTALVYSGSWALAWALAWYIVEKRQPSVRWQELVIWGLPAGLVGGLAVVGIDRFLSEAQDPEQLWRTLTWGPPLVLTGYVLTASVHIGLVGRKLHDYQREWLSRTGAWLLIFAAAWAALFATTVYGTPLLYWTSDQIRWALTAGWLGSTLAGLLAGRAKEGDSSRKSKIRGLIAKIAPYVFIVGLLLWLAVGIDRLLSLPNGDGKDSWDTFMAQRQITVEKLEKQEIDACCASILELLGADPEASESDLDSAEGKKAYGFAVLVGAHWAVLEADGRVPLLGLVALLLSIFLLLGWRVDANEFSMHRLYRNRLVRCYLGASLDKKKRDELRQPFTGFNLDDDIELAHLGPQGPNDPSPGWPKRPGLYAGPYHLVNTALNLVAGDELAWQERKAASFIFSPLYCGFGIPDLQQGYRRTPRYGCKPKELTLGTTMAISGAAASPNMGFRSSPALAFLLTVFNVRLGWWLGNPSRDDKSLNFARQPLWRLSGPSFAVKELFAELLGLTREKTAYVYLSDGGHFENLGLYELVKRRCRFIVACDAGADPKLEFDDLGNAIRKCRADLGIEISISPEQIRLDEGGSTRWHCTVGTIHYSKHQRGTVLYLKSSITGDEPEDLINYRAKHPEFPHQTTGDQWFDESQFESYRRLGEHIALVALEDAVEEATEKDVLNIERLIQFLKERWHPPAAGVEDAITRHSKKLDDLYHRLRTSQELSFLSEQFYPEWHSLMTGIPSPVAPSWLPTDEDQRRQGFYFCSSLIHLMEDLYLDLNLEEQWRHPDNRGWMNLFNHWSWSGMFQITWAVSASTYGLRFQRFCQRRIGLGDCCDVEIADLTENEVETRALTVDLFNELSEKSAALNFVERDIIRGILRNRNNKVDRILAFLVAVQSPVQKPLGIRDRVLFGVGFALLRGRSIVCFRIQDHLRNVGLARRALKKIIPMYDLEMADDFVELDKNHRSMFPQNLEVKFRQVFRSVKRELEQSRDRTDVAEREIESESGDRT